MNFGINNIMSYWFAANKEFIKTIMQPRNHPGRRLESYKNPVGRQSRFAQRSFDAWNSHDADAILVYMLKTEHISLLA
jgi:hypothetical protein